MIRRLTRSLALGLAYLSCAAGILALVFRYFAGDDLR